MVQNNNMMSSMTSMLFAGNIHKNATMFLLPGADPYASIRQYPE